MSIGIYKITNKINNKCYIGQSVNLESRIRSHKSMLKHHNEDNDLLNKATQKYGYENGLLESIQMIVLFGILGMCLTSKVNKRFFC